MGTLATVLAGKKVPTFGDRFRADVEGDIENVDGVMKITKIRVHYTMKVPPGKTEEAREALTRSASSSGPRSPQAWRTARMLRVCDMAAPEDLRARVAFRWVGAS